MDTPLPQPSETFIRADNSGDIDAMSGYFAPFAMVRGDKRYVEGLPAIAAWRANSRSSTTTH
jgi:hypothetical protein